MACAAALSAVAKPVLAADVLPWYRAPERVLDLVRLDSGERFTASFTDDGAHLNAPGYVVLCDALRDRHVDQSRGIVQIAPALLQVLWEIQRVVAINFGDRPIVVHSGYRTLETNGHTEGAVFHSVHCSGAACDFHVPGVPIMVLRDIARKVPLIGGLGWYPRGGVNSDEGWIHADVGDRREWTG